MSDLDWPDLDWLFGLQRFGMTPGLSRVRELLARLGNPQKTFDAVLVGGTNGKGSVSATLAGMLGAPGRRMGLFTSPHLTRFAERFAVNGAELPADQVAAGLARVRPHAEAVGASFFEVVTALAVLLFSEARVDVAVMEVGLGGRLDATNALDPVLSVVTNVGLDHTEILGGTLREIAREKAGILRAARPAVSGAGGEALAVFDASRADVWALGREAAYSAESRGWDGWHVRLSSPLGEVAFETSLLGAHGARNAALAALAAQRLGLPASAIQAGAARTVWPGRLERLPWRGRDVLLDGAHNAEGARALADALLDLGWQKAPLIFGAARGKDHAGMAEALEQVASEVILTRALLSPRSADPEELRLLFAVPSRVAASPAEALALLPPGRALVAGSLYLIGEVRPLLLEQTGEKRERWQ